jgi:hypothetical protein
MDEPDQLSRAIARAGLCDNDDSRFTICDNAGYTCVADANQGDGGEAVEGTFTEEEFKALVRGGARISDVIIVIYDRPAPFGRLYLLYLSTTDDERRYQGLARYRAKGLREFRTLDSAVAKLDDPEFGGYRGTILLVRADSQAVRDYGLTGFEKPTRGRKAKP